MTEPVLLLPGAACDGRLFADTARALPDLRVLPIADILDGASVEEIAVALLAEAPSSFALCGLSLGGLVALELVRHAPDRITRLALMSTSVDPDPPTMRAIREATVERVRSGGFKAQVEVLLPLLLTRAGCAKTALTSLVRDMAQRVGPERYARQLEAIINRPDPRPHLAAVRCPTVVICGAEDVVTPVETHRQLVAGIKWARLVVIEAGAHLLPLERPDAVAAALGHWLTDA